MVSTRSQVNVIEEVGQEKPNLGNRNQLRNPHHGLKEKMKALTQLYEQQKQSSISIRNPNPSPKPDKVRFSTHPSVDLLSGGSCKQKSEKRKLGVVENQVMRENSMPVEAVTKTYVLPHPPPSQPPAVAEDGKENVTVAVGGGRGGSGGGNGEKIMVMRENSMPVSMVSRNYILPQQLPLPQPSAVAENAKENISLAVGGGCGGNGEKIVGFTCPPRRGVVSTTVARKLSMAGGYGATGDGGE